MFAEIPRQVVMIAAALLMLLVGGGGLLLFLGWLMKKHPVNRRHDGRSDG